MKSSTFVGVTLIACTLIAKDTGLAPEVTDLNAKDASIQLEGKLPYLESAYVSLSPKNMSDGLPVSPISIEDLNKEKLGEFIKKLAKKTPIIVIVY